MWESPEESTPAWLPWLRMKVLFDLFPWGAEVSILDRSPGSSHLESANLQEGYTSAISGISVFHSPPYIPFQRTERLWVYN